MNNPGTASQILVRRLNLLNFRNYDSLELNLDEGIQLIAGANAQGKTNLLEALYMLSTTRLLRGQRDAEAIQDGFEASTISTEIDPAGTALSITLDRSARKRARLNGAALPRASDLIGRLPCICVSSADLAIVTGEPSDRRLFLDLELSQLYPAYLRHLAVFKRALEQRNVCLKAAQTERIEAALFETWECEIAAHGAAIREARATFVANLLPYSQSAHAQMGGGEELFLEYLPRDLAIDQETFLSELARIRPHDIHRGTTTVGPHRDDIRILIGGREGRLFGSQGQQRTAMLSMKLGTMELERGERGGPPLLLLDDILSDLDGHRRARLMDWVLSQAGQTLVTCTEPAAAGPGILSRARIMHVQSGCVS